MNDNDNKSHVVTIIDHYQHVKLQTTVSALNIVQTLIIVLVTLFTATYNSVWVMTVMDPSQYASHTQEHIQFISRDVRDMHHDASQDIYRTLTLYRLQHILAQMYLSGSATYLPA
jgi:hypothetical protein